jgi:antitoxin Phd
MKTWTLSEAKNKFSEVVDRAINEGPQEVSVATKEPVVVISRKELDKLAPGGVKEFFESAPDMEDLADMVAQLKKHE